MRERERRIPIVDKRVSAQPGPQAGSGEPEGGAPEAEVLGDIQVTESGDDSMLPQEPGASAPAVEDAGAAQEQNDFLDDLRRLQADFDNYRKRMMREQAATADRAKARFMEQLLPVLDAFDQARAHDDGSNGTELIYKQLWSVLEAEGLQEIPAEGVAFDPHVHDAVDSREDADVDEIVCRSVYRRGYRVGDQVLRAAMVVVARPPEPEAPSTEPGPDPEHDAPETDPDAVEAAEG